MGKVSSGFAFQATDLQRNHRAVLDAARESDALIRDKDGRVLVMRSAVEDHLRQYISEVLVGLTHLQLALTLPATHRPVAMYGPFAWISVMPESDQKEFISDVMNQVLLSNSAGECENLETLIGDWKVTAAIWNDDELRRDLTGEIDEPLHDVDL